ncbi:MAG: hypothetical protein ACI81S_000324 [Sphingobacteriales bacterium]|jgi:hypothetical protein
MRTLLGLFILSFASIFSSCGDGVSQEIPEVYVDLTIDVNNPEYGNLRQIKGFTMIEGVGVKGIIIFHNEVNQYFAYDMNCSYQPNGDCATVVVDSATLMGYDKCCNSYFSLENGFPFGGPALRPLKQYTAILQGPALLRISNF